MAGRHPAADELLRACERSALHLEMRDQYMRSDPMFTTWQSGFRYDHADRCSWWHPWHQLVADASARGAAVRRARIVSEPVSEYIRFEYDVTFMNVMAGELVRWLPRRRASDLALPGNDFWVFDDQVVLWNHFTGEGEVSPQGREVTEDAAAVKACTAAFEAVWDRAVPHEEYRPS
jgi:uncharacterized protein DUF6879